jgi:hypothetical protein
MTTEPSGSPGPASGVPESPPSGVPLSSPASVPASTPASAVPLSTGGVPESSWEVPASACGPGGSSPPEHEATAAVSNTAARPHPSPELNGLRMRLFSSGTLIADGLREATGRGRSRSS